MSYSLESLVQTLQQDQYQLNLDIKPQIQSLLDKARFLRDLVQNKCYPIEKNLEIQIREAVHEAEDMIDPHVMNCPRYSRSDCFPLDLTALVEKFESIKENLQEIEICPVDTFQYDEPYLTSIVVGLDKDVNQLLDRLTGGSSNLEIIAIVGMGGIGKTTLAQKLYNSYSSTHNSHFDICAWSTISQKHDLLVSLRMLLGCLANYNNMMDVENYYRLGIKIHQALTGRRYLIVVDDIWDTQVWDAIKEFFPDDRRGSRVLLTTRDSGVACHANPFGKHHEMYIMKDEVSWELLRRKVFGQENCPVDLVEVGKNIARGCRGLPLTVVIVAGILSTLEKTLQSWMPVDENINQTISNHCPHWFKTLLLSYNNLACHLKPCFLYVGAFPEDSEIQSSKIVRLWIAEGFVKQIEGNSSEDTAEAYLNALISTNLLWACRKDPNRKVKSFRIHDFCREFCRKQAVEEKFLWFKKIENHNSLGDTEIMRRVSVHPLSINAIDKKLKFLRSFLCIGSSSLNVDHIIEHSKLLRVLDVFQLQFNQFPSKILQLELLRYLAFSCDSELPSSITSFRNLETLIIHNLSSNKRYSLPSELWEMTQLKHIKSKQVCEWPYPTSVQGEGVVLDKLQTLSNVHLLAVTNKVLEKIPSLKKLGIYSDIPTCGVVDLTCLKMLEKLKCTSDFSSDTYELLCHIRFPLSLKKLTLPSIIIPPKVMSKICLLSNLEKLKLQKCDFLSAEWQSTEPYCNPTEPEWDTSEGEFTSLRYLEMEELNLVGWHVDCDNFPRLQHLVIRNCYSLKAIPLSIGEIQTLELIDVEKCSRSVHESALFIHDEQMNQGNKLKLVSHGA